MLLVTLLLWFGLLHIVKEPGSAGADTLIPDLCVQGSGSHRPRHCLTLE